MLRKEIKVDRVKRNFYLTLFIFIAVLAITYFYTRPQKVERVVNGNQLVLSNGNNIYLVGVWPGRHAQEFVSKLVKGKEVKLYPDQMAAAQNGYRGAYVYLLDGTFVNAEVIKAGYARVDTTIPFKCIKEFKQFQAEAQVSGKGIWSY